MQKMKKDKKGVDKGEKVFLIVIDNFRLDQWRILSKEIGDIFDIDEDQKGLIDISYNEKIIRYLYSLVAGLYLK